MKKQIKKTKIKSINCSSNIPNIKPSNEQSIKSNKQQMLQTNLTNRPNNEQSIKPEVKLKNTKISSQIPPTNTIIYKKFKGQTYEIKVLENGFELEGKTYKSLSALAIYITGYQISGFVFFKKELIQNAK